MPGVETERVLEFGSCLRIYRKVVLYSPITTKFSAWMIYTPKTSEPTLQMSVYHPKSWPVGGFELTSQKEIQSSPKKSTVLLVTSPLLIPVEDALAGAIMEGCSVELRETRGWAWLVEFHWRMDRMGSFNSQRPVSGWLKKYPPFWAMLGVPDHQAMRMKIMEINPFLGTVSSFQIHGAPRGISCQAWSVFDGCLVMSTVGLKLDCH